MAQNSTELEEFEVFEKPLILSTSNNCTYLNQNIKGTVFGSINNSILSLNDEK